MYFVTNYKYIVLVRGIGNYKDRKINVSVKQKTREIFLKNQYSRLRIRRQAEHLSIANGQ